MQKRCPNNRNDGVCVSPGAPVWTRRQGTWSWTVGSRISPLPSSASPPHPPTRLTRASPHRPLPSPASSATHGPPPTPRTMSKSPPYNLRVGCSSRQAPHRHDLSTFSFDLKGVASWDWSDKHFVSGWIFFFSSVCFWRSELCEMKLNGDGGDKCSWQNPKQKTNRHGKPPHPPWRLSEFHLHAFETPSLHPF